MLAGLAQHYGFDVDAPFEKLTPEAQQVVLYGSGKEKISFKYPGEKGRSVAREHAFEGIVPNLERRYKETDSAVVREELAKYLNSSACPECSGTRLRREARYVFVSGQPIYAVSRMPLNAAREFFAGLQLSGAKAAIAEKIVAEIMNRLQFLNNVGVDYLSLDRSAETLSGGEAQRIRLASQIGSGLTGVMYVLDEPSIGLHQRDNHRLLSTLKTLRDIGNTVIVVEHDQEAIESADFVIDMGPGAGEHGGQVVAMGSPEEVARNPASLTGQYLSATRSIPTPLLRNAPQQDRWLRLAGARGNNLKNIQLDLPLGLFVCVSGVSGSGKSTLINDTLYRAAAQHVYGSAIEPAAYDEIHGLEQFDKVKKLLADLEPFRGNIAGLVDELFPTDNAAVVDLRELALSVLDEAKEAKDLFSLMMKEITQPDIPPEVKEVRVMSLHKSKGLSAPYVFIAQCVQGVLPQLPKPGTPKATVVTRLPPSVELLAAPGPRTPSTAPRPKRPRSGELCTAWA
jgi:excinuclease ABC subunit A